MPATHPEFPHPVCMHSDPEGVTSRSGECRVKDFGGLND